MRSLLPGCWTQSSDSRCAFAGVALAVLVGCATPRPEYSAQPTIGGIKRFTLRSYFGFDMPRERTEEGMQREAQFLCPAGYEVDEQTTNPRRTAWGAENGQHDLFWQVRCKS